MQGRVPASLRSSSRSKLCGETGAEQERLDRRKLTALAHDHVEDDQGDRRSHLNYVIFGPIDKPNDPMLPRVRRTTRSKINKPRLRRRIRVARSLLVRFDAPTLRRSGQHARREGPGMASHASEETGRLVPAVPFPTRRGHSVHLP